MQNLRDDVDAETEEVLNEFSFLGSDTDDASHELRVQTDTTDWGKSWFLLFLFPFTPPSWNIGLSTFSSVWGNMSSVHALFHIRYTDSICVAVVEGASFPFFYYPTSLLVLFLGAMLHLVSTRWHTETPKKKKENKTWNSAISFLISLPTSVFPPRATSYYTVCLLKFLTESQRLLLLCHLSSVFCRRSLSNCMPPTNVVCPQMARLVNRWFISF